MPATTGVDMYRGTDGVELPPVLSDDIWAEAVEASVVMSTTRKITMPGPGITIPSITEEPKADWVAETAEKPVSRHKVGKKSITPYKLAVIEPFSMEFRRDLSKLYAEMARRLPLALARAFDETVFGVIPVPGENFDTLADATNTAELGADPLADLVDLYQAVSDGGGDINAWLATPSLVGKLIQTQAGAAEKFDLTSKLAVGSVFGAPLHKTRHKMPDDTLGYAGDFQADAVYGTVEGVQVSISDQATITDTEAPVDSPDRILNLWQRNMFAVRAEIEVAFRMVSEDRFGILTGSASS